MSNDQTLIDKNAADFARFVEDSPSSYHAANALVNRFKQGGFTEVTEVESWQSEPGSYVFSRDGAVLAWQIPDTTKKPQGFRIVGSHTDSPTFKVKPSGSSVTTDGWGQIDVEVYGGMLTNSWLDRELGFAGRVVSDEGTQVLVRTDAVARIPQLAIHLDRGVNTNGLKLDNQRHLHPVWTLDKDLNFLDYVADQAGLGSQKRILGHDLVAYVTQKPERFGNDKQFLASGRLDNLSSVHPALVAFLDLDMSRHEDICVFVAFDHEEIGSASRSGAAGPILEGTLRRLASLFDDSTQYYQQMIARSSCVSADASHGVHPNYSEYHDPQTHPILGKGPVLKLNANQRYATDAVGSALWNRACASAEVPSQAFVSNNAIPCGSTIGPITATRLGITTVDVGIPILSMHSAREMCHLADLHYLSRGLRSYWEAA